MEEALGHFMDCRITTVTGASACVFNHIADDKSKITSRDIEPPRIPSRLSRRYLRLANHPVRATFYHRQSNAAPSWSNDHSRHLL